MKGKNVKTKRTWLKILKFMLVVLVCVIAYGIAVYTSSFEQANSKLVSLFLFALLGFLGFYVIYYVIYLITISIQVTKRKKAVATVIECDDAVSELFSDNKNKFRYNPKCDFKVNFDIYKEQVLSVIKQIALGFNKAKSDYYYLNYTVYDALEIIDNVINGVDVKISPIFKLLKAEDKPLIIVEKLLVKAIENDNKPKAEKEQNKFIKAVGEKLLNAGLFVFRRNLENTANDLMVFIGLEAFKAYNKNGAKYLPIIEKEGENV